MRQVTLSVPLEVKPESCIRLNRLIDDLKKAEETPPYGHPEDYARIATAVPTLHFMSMSVFPSADYDPSFILEVNFDGETGVFWGQLEAALGRELRDILRCCKRPLDEDGPLYDAVTAPGSASPVAAYLEARAQRPSVYFHGNRGMTRQRIGEEADLFRAVRAELAGASPGASSPYRGISAQQVHNNLRNALLPRFPLLGEKAPTRIGVGESIRDWVNLLVFAAAVLLGLALPWLVLAALLPPRSYLIVWTAALLLAGLLAWRARRGLPGTETSQRFSILRFLLGHAGLLAVLLIGYLLLIGIPALLLTGAGLELWHRVAASAPDRVVEWGALAWSIGETVALGGLGAIPTLVALVVWLRYLEQRDSSHDAPVVDERMLREMVRREDWIAQNHMGSIVLIKPGILRTIIIHAGHRGLGLILKVIGRARRGYLGSMRTVHFAHWAFLNNSSRLLFLSNFDHSWDSYLDDFIEKAAVGLTLAWGSCVGFPPTRFLVKDGAAHGRKFKAWALASRAVSRFWYSAYKDLTVDQIERNCRVAAGLRRASLRPSEAAEWIRDL